MSTPAPSARLRRPEAHDTGPAGTRSPRGGRFSRLSQPFPSASFAQGFFLKHRLCPCLCQPAPSWLRSEIPQAAQGAGAGGGGRAAEAGPMATPGREPGNSGALTALLFRSRARALGRGSDGAPQWTNSLGVSVCVAGLGESAAAVGAPAWDRVRRRGPESVMGLGPSPVSLPPVARGSRRRPSRLFAVSSLSSRSQRSGEASSLVT